MGPLNALLDGCRDAVRHVMRGIARGLNKLTRGQLSPTSITIIGFLAHIPIAWLIAERQYPLAAVLLVFFGLFDTLDGELARLQGKDSSAGMLLDSTTDRMKEVLLYVGAAFALVAEGRPYFAVWAVAACGASLCVSYVNAWGEAVASRSKLNKHELNKSFRSGLLRFEIRMFLLFVGLLADQLPAMLIVIALFSAYTAFQRLISIIRHLNNAEA